MRAGILVLGPLISKFGSAKVLFTRWMSIGARPVNSFKALKKLGMNLKFLKDTFMLMHKWIKRI